MAARRDAVIHEGSVLDMGRARRTVIVVVIVRVLCIPCAVAFLLFCISPLSAHLPVLAAE
jgi:hypothetical protein